MNGDCYIWELDGTKALVGDGYVGGHPTTVWQLKGVGDYNGDGKSDLAFQNSLNGDCYIWELDGTKALVGDGYVGGHPGADWHATA